MVFVIKVCLFISILFQKNIYMISFFINYLFFYCYNIMNQILKINKIFAKHCLYKFINKYNTNI